MATIKKSCEEISRNCAMANWDEAKSINASSTVKGLYNVVIAGSLQRIANSLEKMEIPFLELRNQLTTSRAMVIKRDIRIQELDALWNKEVGRNKRLEKLIRELGGIPPKHYRENG